MPHEFKYYGPRHRPDGSYSHGSIEAWTPQPDPRDVFLLANPGESRANLEQRALATLAQESSRVDHRLAPTVS